VRSTKGGNPLLINLHDDWI